VSATLASSGKEAMEILVADTGFDLVITDMYMPGMDGIQLAQHVKKHDTTLPVILLTSVGDESKKKYPDLFYSVLNKPAKQQQLFQVVKSALKAEGEGIFKLADEQKPKHVLSQDFSTKYPLTILLAEDNLVNQKLTVRVLNKLGYQKIEVAQNGEEAMEKLDNQFYEVILMDVQMPVMDGLEATRLIRLRQTRQPVIIAMTANAMVSDKEACIQAGMDEYISKPINLEQLMNALEKASGEYRIMNIE
jgi:CheY-like chemotaxis protein